MTQALTASDLKYGYRPSESIVDGFNLGVSTGEWLGIVGPNGSGKSTVLRMLARLVSPQRGTVSMGDQNMAGMNSKSIARQMTMLTQTQEAALDITVRDLVRRGRNPHLRWYEECRGKHEEVVDWALQVTSMGGLQHRSLLELSGGERQRAWLAMCMAQTPNTLLLDEPTTYLDIAHQLELMELIRLLNREQGITVIMVLHDLNQAARYCDRIVAMKQGAVVREGKPSDVFQVDFFRDVFGIEAKVHNDDGVPVFLPCGVVRQQAHEEIA
ncbi:iron ABC transporter ATP-binding protein [Paenibacillus baekrokdamisoli]|uniref:Iron ABC transporter ATP-binding protein n=1 Tax=Paenibacillus baekrokdamisoli TaxID=1712516 RepID=A0A3G9J8B1_9BACL|nr:ABC transporter ATP-binding protein [Paenibacillus baekrokdamisoli]MBB3071380.1 iron complex transport system ATP-binding protein [Paenibacillus baekrokdamisoli]BBH24585.1 iron ABC transporter ATP-binding protein [Paenibacillus baekrokdamisoli]